MSKFLILSFLFVGALKAQSKFIEGGFINCDSVLINDGESVIDLTNLNITKIELVSFEYTFLKYKNNRYDPHGNRQILSKGFGKWIRNKSKAIIDFNIENLSIDYDCLEENSSIESQDDINEIVSNIKNSYASVYWKAGGALCYQPRNAIVFKSENNKIEFVIELCLECSNYVIIAQGINPLEKRLGICRRTIDYIIRLFKSKGITHGIE